MANFNMSPTKRLQPEVWSKILSFLPPDELGRASEVLFSPRKPSATDASGLDVDLNLDLAAMIQDYASRMAVESMIQTAVQHFSKHLEDAANGDHDDGGESHLSNLQVEEFLSSNCDSDDGTQLSTTMTSECRRQQFARYKDQKWPSLYTDLYMVYDYIKPGFGKDRSEAIAHAVHSLYLLSGPEDF